MKKALIAPPFVGEFGWELMRWHGYLRKISKNYSCSVIACRSGNEYIYTDFADYVIGLDIVGGIKDCWGASGHIINDYYKFEKLISVISKDHEVEKIDPSRNICLGNIEQEFIKFGTSDKNNKYDLVFHARNREDIKDNRYGIKNWPINNWNEISKYFHNYKKVSIGTIKDSFYVAETDDKRGINLSETCNILASSKLCVGPSSGPMHLASLCGCEHLIWVVKGEKFASPKKNRRESIKNRYIDSWNPLKTNCEVIDEYDWQPSVDVIVKNIEKLL